LFFAVALAAAACGGDEATSTDQGVAETEASDTSETGTDETTDDNTSDDTTSDDSDGGGGGETSSPLPNSCPAEGCEVAITAAEAGPDGEIELTFEANYTPDFEQNHIHVFWDSQETGAVSSDYEAKGYEVQGKWHPTDEYPVYITQSDASVGSVSRGSSTTVCVTAADTDHAVIDAAIFDCRDVSDLLAS
jgi:hypothetical protein